MYKLALATHPIITLKTAPPVVGRFKVSISICYIPTIYYYHYHYHHQYCLACINRGENLTHPEKMVIRVHITLIFTTSLLQSCFYDHCIIQYHERVHWLLSLPKSWLICKILLQTIEIWARRVLHFSQLS